jgi:hypothetical protein
MGVLSQVDCVGICDYQHIKQITAKLNNKTETII